jgi:membrane protein insertase Oxa1/YidC/SpoIIIJ
MRRMKFMKKIQPDLNEFRKRIDTLKKTDGNLARAEKMKMYQWQAQRLPKMNKLSFLFAFSQMTILGSWAGLVQRFSLQIEDYPEMLTGGFFWFKDLSVPDPFFLLPLINNAMLFLIVYVIILKIYIYNHFSQMTQLQTMLFSSN